MVFISLSFLLSFCFVTFLMLVVMYFLPSMPFIINSQCMSLCFGFSLYLLVLTTIVTFSCYSSINRGPHLRQSLSFFRPCLEIYSWNNWIHIVSRKSLDYSAAFVTLQDPIASYAFSLSHLHPSVSLLLYASSPTFSNPPPCPLTRHFLIPHRLRILLFPSPSLPSADIPAGRQTRGKRRRRGRGRGGGAIWPLFTCLVPFLSHLVLLCPFVRGSEKGAVGLISRLDSINKGIAFSLDISCL